MMNICAIIPAAGRGVRLGRGVAKPYRLLHNIPLFIHTLRIFAKHPLVGSIVVVVEKQKRSYAISLIRRFHVEKVSAVVAGGASRCASVWEGLQHVPQDCEFVLIHDGARPYVSGKLIARVIKGTKHYEACIPALKAHETLKQVDKKGFVKTTLARESVWHVQTPQGFTKKIIMMAYQRQYPSFSEAITDDSMLVEKIGHKIKVIEGEITNKKITTSEDMRGECLI